MYCGFHILSTETDTHFQIGGVVMRSPFIAIAAYEKKLGLPENYLNCSM
jgi:hypothetical protein